MEKSEIEKLEMLESSMREHRIILESLQESKVGSVQASENNNEFEQLKRIVGDFHPGPASKTYRELYDSNLQLSEELKKSNSALTSIKEQLNEQKQINQKQEKEIMMLRNRPEKTVFAGEGEKRNKNNVISRKGKAGLKAHQRERTEAEQRKDLQTLLFSPRFSDSQVSLLAQILSEDYKLPIEVLMQIVDPRLTTDRMMTLYLLLCKQYHVEPIRIMQVTSAGVADSGNGGEYTAPAKSMLHSDCGGTVADNNGGSEKGRLRRRAKQQIEGGKMR